jgi:Icc-related predicted phosphoesterase
MVCVTHHPPSYDCIIDANKKQKYISLYASALDDLLIKDNIHTWIYGHTHYNCDFTHKNGTRVISNQLGKPKDKILDYQKKKILFF